jgi:LPS-assembly protein
MGIFGQGDGRATAFIGQSYRIHADNDLKRQVGIESNLSDIVGRVEIRPHRYLDLLYRFRVDDKTREFRRNEVEFSAGPKAFRLSGNYIFIDDDPSDAAVAKREELNLSFTSRIDDFWSVALRTQRDLRDDGGTLFSGMQVTYEDECFIFSANVERRFTQDADFEPADKIFVRLTFKNLGSLSTSG